MDNAKNVTLQSLKQILKETYKRHSEESKKLSPIRVKHSPLFASPAIRIYAKRPYVAYKPMADHKNDLDEIIPVTKLREYLQTKADAKEKVRIPEYGKSQDFLESKKESRREHSKSQRFLPSMKHLTNRSEQKSSFLNLSNSSKGKPKHVKNSQSLCVESSNNRKEISHCYVNYKKQIGRCMNKHTCGFKKNELDPISDNSPRNRRVKKYVPMPMNRKFIDKYQEILQGSIKWVSQCMSEVRLRKKHSKDFYNTDGF